MLRHTFVTTMLDAGVDLRDVQIAARHADPRTTMRYDRARKNLDRHPQLHPGRVHGLRHLNELPVVPRSVRASADDRGQV
jgi:integrase